MLWRFLRLFLALLLSQAVLLVLLLTVFAAAISNVTGDDAVLQPHTTLRVHLAGDIIEYPTLPALPFLHDEPLSQTAIVEGLERAAADARVDGVILEIDFAGMGWGKAAEVRGAVERFRASGKPVLAFAAHLDELGLYLASACDSVFLPPHGGLALDGLVYGGTYFRGLLDKVGVRANVHRIGAYKDAAEPFVRTGMSEASRAQSEWLLEAIWGEFRRGVAASRRVDVEAVDAAVARGVLEPDEAVALGLVDGVRTRGDIEAYLTAYDGTDNILRIQDYFRTPPARTQASGTIAVVHARGLILPGKHDYHPATGTILGEDSAVRDLHAAANDDAVDAIVLRIDSPGGEVTASDGIGHAVALARDTKPVVVSMVDVAASGGYMIAYRANRVVALPTTITGSIGSITGKLNLHGLYEKLGLNRDSVSRGAYPRLWSDDHDWSAAEESLIARHHWASYDRWIAGIARERDLAVAAVDSVARGRVWTGRQAIEHRLVDELGDLRHAVRVAQELAGLPAEARPRLLHYPKPVGFLEALREERLRVLAAAVERWAHASRLPVRATWSVLDRGVPR